MANNIDKHIGARVGQKREQANISADAAAKKCGLSKNDYVLSEDGKRRFSAAELYILTQYMGIRFTELFEPLINMG